MRSPGKFLKDLELEIVKKGEARGVVLDSLRKLWPYLAERPGEQIPYQEFAAILGCGSVTGATARLSSLLEIGYLEKTSCRRGRGGGVGFICPWLEARRATPGKATAQTSRGVSVHDELTAIEALAEKSVLLAKAPADDGDAAAITTIDAMREIQSRANRIRLAVRGQVGSG